MTERKELFSCRAAAGSRTYFFDVKETREGVKYLVISESRHKGSGHEHSRVMVFEENMAAFADGLKQATNFLEHEQEIESRKEQDKEKAWGLEEIRQQHAQAYARWTPEEDARLKQQVKQGKRVAELADIFQRQPGAIRSRLSKLGLLPD